MHYYQVSYIVIGRQSPMEGTWTVYESEEPYNPNTLKSYLRTKHNSEVVIVAPVTEIPKESYDHLKGILPTE